MISITLQVLDGADRGRVFEKLKAPVTIGREEGNTIQLNDERVSRFHIKIQQDHTDLVMTDLESTNGTKVNNEEVQLRILRAGDMITVGRTTLRFGTREEINSRFDSKDSEVKSKARSDSEDSSPSAALSDWQEDPNYQLALLDVDPPKIPERLSPGQAAQLSEMLEFLHLQLRRIVMDCEIGHRAPSIELSREQWQQVLDLQARMAEYILKIGRPT